MKLRTETIQGIPFEIEVGTDGTFWTEYDGSRVDATSLEQLKTKLKTQIKAKLSGVEIPFCYWEGYYRDEKGVMRKGVAVGIHSGNQNIMVRMGNDKASSQMSSRYGYPVEKIEEYTALQNAMTKARMDIEKFEKANRIDLREALLKKLGKTEEDAQA